MVLACQSSFWIERAGEVRDNPNGLTVQNEFLDRTPRADHLNFGLLRIIGTEESDPT